MQVNISVVLDTRRKKANGYPVKLRVYYKGKAKLFSLGKDLSKQEFESSYNATKPKTDLKRIRDELRAMETKANEIAKNLNPFNLARFETLFYGETKTKSDVIGYFNDYIEKLNKNDQVKTAIGYECSRNSISCYLKIINKSKVKKFLFDDVTIEFLNGYEKWMLSNNNSEATVGIYVRNLRTLYNLAIKNGEASQDLFPFGKGAYQIPSGSKVKKVLTLDELKRLFFAEVEKGSLYEKAKAFWFFSYMCNGINMKDIAGLKYSDITNESISFVRAKTKAATRGNQKRIVAANSDYTKGVIEKYGNKPVIKNSYVFPILKDGMSEVEKVNTIKNFVRFINQHIKKLAKKLGINESISTYWARHSFATTAMRKGVIKSLIQDSLGHQSASTTENYLAGFDIEAKQELADTLLDFA